MVHRQSRCRRDSSPDHASVLLCRCLGSNESIVQPRPYHHRILRKHTARLSRDPISRGPKLCNQILFLNSRQQASPAAGKKSARKCDKPPLPRASGQRRYREKSIRTHAIGISHPPLPTSKPNLVASCSVRCSDAPCNTRRIHHNLQQQPAEGLQEPNARQHR